MTQCGLPVSRLGLPMSKMPDPTTGGSCPINCGRCQLPVRPWQTPNVRRLFSQLGGYDELLERFCEKLDPSPTQLELPDEKLEPTDELFELFADQFGLYRVS